MLLTSKELKLTMTAACCPERSGIGREMELTVLERGSWPTQDQADAMTTGGQKIPHWAAL